MVKLQPMRHDEERRLVDQMITESQYISTSVQGTMSAATRVLNTTEDVVIRNSVVMGNIGQTVENVGQTAQETMRAATGTLAKGTQMMDGVVRVMEKTGMMIGGAAIVGAAGKTVVDAAGMVWTQRRADRTTRETIQRADTLANKVLETGDRRLKEAIFMADAQMTACRQDAKELGCQIIHTVQEESKRAVGVADQRLDQAMRLTQEEVRASRQDAKEVVREGIKVAEKGLEVGDQRLEQVISTADAQMTAYRQDLKEVSLGGVGVLDRGVQELLAIAKETSHNILFLAEQSVSIGACLYLGCNQQNPWVGYPALMMGLGLVGISVQNWRKYFSSLQKKTEEKIASEPVPGRISVEQNGVEKVLLTESDMLWLRNQCVEVFLIMQQKAVCKNLRWTQAESDWLKKKDRTVYSIIASKIPNAFAAPTSDKLYTEQRGNNMNPIPQTVTIPAASIQQIMDHVRSSEQRMEALSKRQEEIDKDNSKLNYDNHQLREDNDRLKLDNLKTREMHELAIQCMGSQLQDRAHQFAEYRLLSEERILRLEVSNRDLENRLSHSENQNSTLQRQVGKIQDTALCCLQEIKSQRDFISKGLERDKKTSETIGCIAGSVAGAAVVAVCAIPIAGPLLGVGVGVAIGGGVGAYSGIKTGQKVHLMNNNSGYKNLRKLDVTIEENSKNLTDEPAIKMELEDLTIKENKND